ncbi:MAG: GNAT family N-acetyltransferase [Bacteroidetes bacterium]|nr:GNAT family N-acetyltransferase [Bacteroidota bacterium]
MRFNTIIPILYSSSIINSLNHYTDVLGFENKWDWGSPPTFGGIYKNGIEIFFCENGQGHPGTWISIMVDNVDEYYETINAKGANIISPPESMEWNIREMLVKDPDGHIIRFGNSISGKKNSGLSMPASVRIVQRIPEPGELLYLSTAVGWAQPAEKPSPEIPLSSIAIVVVAEDSVTNKIIGCAFLLTDSTNFYYVKNVIVHPAWQSKRIGTALMQELTAWLDKNAPDNAMVALHTGENLAPFYKRFGFTKAFSMQRFIKR